MVLRQHRVSSHSSSEPADSQLQPGEMPSGRAAVSDGEARSRCSPVSNPSPSVSGTNSGASWSASAISNRGPGKGAAVAVKKTESQGNGRRRFSHYSRDHHSPDFSPAFFCNCSGRDASPRRPGGGSPALDASARRPCLNVPEKLPFFNAASQRRQDATREEPQWISSMPFTWSISDWTLARRRGKSSGVSPRVSKAAGEKANRSVPARSSAKN